MLLDGFLVQHRGLVTFIGRIIFHMKNVRGDENQIPIVYYFLRAQLKRSHVFRERVNLKLVHPQLKFCVAKTCQVIFRVIYSTQNFAAL